MSLRPLFTASLMVASLTGPVLAQPDGKTAEDFVLTYFAGYGEWQIFCGDWGSPETAQCDLRRQDVYSPRPDFRASVTFIRVAQDETQVDIGLEAISSLIGGGLEAVDGSWSAPTQGCLIGTCRLRGDDAETLIDNLRGGIDATLAFTDYGVESQSITWDNALFDAAWEDFVAQRDIRGLP